MAILSLNEHVISGLSETVDSVRNLNFEGPIIPALHHHIHDGRYEPAQAALLDIVISKVNKPTERILGQKRAAIRLGIGLGFRVVNDTAETTEGESIVTDHLRGDSNIDAISKLAMSSTCGLEPHQELNPLIDALSDFYMGSGHDPDEFYINRQLTSGGLRLAVGVADQVAADFLSQGFEPHELGIPLQSQTVTAA